MDTPERRTYEIQTLHRTYDMVAECRSHAIQMHEESDYGAEVVIDCKDKTAKRAHERARGER